MKRYDIYGTWNAFKEQAGFRTVEDLAGEWCKAEDALSEIARLQGTIAAQQKEISQLKRRLVALGAMACDARPDGVLYAEGCAP